MEEAGEYSQLCRSGAGERQPRHAQEGGGPPREVPGTPLAAAGHLSCTLEVTARDLLAIDLRRGVEIWRSLVRYARRRLALGGGHVWQSGVLGKWSAGGKALAVLHVASGRGQSEVNGQLGELSRS